MPGATKSRQPRRRDTARAWNFVRTAAEREAAHTGRREADVEDVLLGLLVSGGPSARLLLGAGVTPQRLRSAPLIVPEAAPAAPPPATASRPEDTRVSDRVRVVLRPALDDEPLGDDRDLLLALLDDETGRARRLLEQCGVAPDELRSAALQWQPVDDWATYRTEPSEPGSEQSRQSLWASAMTGPGDHVVLTVSASLFCTVPADQVWALFRAPERQPSWDPSCCALTVDQDGFQRIRSGSVRSGLLEQSVEEADHQIAWTRRQAGAPHSVLWARVDPDGGATRLYLQGAWAAGGLLRVWPFSVWVRNMLRTRLQVTAQNIAQAASR